MREYRSPRPRCFACSRPSPVRRISASRGAGAHCSISCGRPAQFFSGLPRPMVGASSQRPTPPIRLLRRVSTHASVGPTPPLLRLETGSAADAVPFDSISTPVVYTLGPAVGSRYVNDSFEGDRVRVAVWVPALMARDRRQCRNVSCGLVKCAARGADLDCAVGKWRGSFQPPGHRPSTGSPPVTPITAAGPAKGTASCTGPGHRNSSLQPGQSQGAGAVRFHPTSNEVGGDCPRGAFQAAARTQAELFCCCWPRERRFLVLGPPLFTRFFLEIRFSFPFLNQPFSGLVLCWEGVARSGWSGTFLGTSTAQVGMALVPVGSGGQRNGNPDR